MVSRLTKVEPASSSSSATAATATAATATLCNVHNRAQPSNVCKETTLVSNSTTNTLRSTCVRDSRNITKSKNSLVGTHQVSNKKQKQRARRLLRQQQAQTKHTECDECAMVMKMGGGDVHAQNNTMEGSDKSDKRGSDTPLRKNRNRNQDSEFTEISLEDNDDKCTSQHTVVHGHTTPGCVSAATTNESRNSMVGLQDAHGLYDIITHADLDEEQLLRGCRRGEGLLFENAPSGQEDACVIS